MYLNRLAEKGEISKTNLKTRALKLTKEPIGASEDIDSVSIPLVGNVAAGAPILAEQNIESYLTISGDFLGTGTYFVLKAKGPSMIKVGIENGDYVVIRQQPSAEEGQIVVAMTEDGECTLKRYYKDKRRKKIRLHPENDEMKDMFFDNIEIQGIAVKVIKNLDN
jgi:repressor LexA